MMDPSKLRFLACVHPLLIDTDEFPDFPYSQVGTCFLVMYQGEVILVSARHCFENQKVKAAEVCIVDPAKSDGSFLSFETITHMSPSEETDDKDFADIVLMHARQGSIDPKSIVDGTLPVFPVARHLVVAPDSKEVQKFILRGYPLDANAVNHEVKRIPRTPLTVGAKYLESDACEHVHVLEVEDYRIHTDGNGMSGGPAIALVQAGGSVHAKLAGIVIRGFHGSLTARIIDARVLLQVLERLPQ